MNDIDWIMMALFILVIVIFTLCSSGCSPVKMFSKTVSLTTFAKVSDKEFDEWCQKMGSGGTLYSTLVNLNVYMKNNFHYKADKIDFPRDYREFLLQAEGDCDDYAYIALECLHRLGYTNAVMVSVHSKTSGHSYTYINGYNIGNWGLIKKVSIEASNSYYIPDWEYYLIRDRNLKLLRKVYRK